MTVILTPFSSSNYQVRAEIKALSEALRLEYLVEGPVNQIQWPETSPSPTRTDELWKTTCFEFFWTEPHIKSYWEYNFSPSLDWNCYFFSDYRIRGSSSCLSLSPQIQFEKSSTQLFFSTEIPMISSMKNAPHILVSPTVILNSSEGFSYWSPQHLTSTPDFHKRDSFLEWSFQ